LVDYYELEARTIVLIGTSILAFVLGCIITRRRKGPREEVSGSSETIRQAPLEYSIKTLLLLNFVGVLVFGYQMNSAYGLSAYVTGPAVIRADSEEWTHLGLLGLLLLLDYPLLVCSWVHHLVAKKWKWFSVFGVVLVLAQTYLSTMRINLVIYVLTCIFLWIYWNRWCSLTRTIARRASIIAALILAYFLAIGSLYGKIVSEQTDVYNMRDFSVTSEAALVLATPYIYATGSFPTFQEAMKDVGQMSWGTHTFYPVARILYALGVLRERPEGLTFDFYLVPIPFNVYTSLFAFYQDFGVAGVVLLPFLLGWFETRMYFQMKAHPSLFSLGASSAFAVASVFSAFCLLITGVSLCYYCLVLYGISKYCDIRPPVLRPVVG